MFAETRYLDSPTGARLAFHVHNAEATPLGIVIISHGMSEHSRRYAPFAAYLAARGYHVYALDHRGHGETTAPDATNGQFAKRDGASKVVADILAIRDLAAEQNPGLPLLLFGHSMGGLICLNVAISHPDRFAGFAVWNCDFSAALLSPVMRLILGIERWLKGSDVPSAMLPRLTFETWGKAIKGHRTLFDWLSNDPKEVDAYIADPLCGFPCTVSLWMDVTGFIERGANKGLLKSIPGDKALMLLGGGQDPASRGGKAITWLAKRLSETGHSRVTTLIFPDARHETLNDNDREKAMRAFSDWADGITTVPSQTA